MSGKVDQQTINALKALDEKGVLGSFDEARKSQIMDSVKAEHSDTAGKIYKDYTNSDSSVNAMMYYYARNIDLADVQSGVLQRVKAEASDATHDSQLLKRQFEINEWSAANKAETIFLMQLLLMGVTFTIFLLFLTRVGLVPASIFSVVSMLLLIAFILTVIIRARYTSIARDRRYWNRRGFPRMPPPPTNNCPTQGAAPSSAPSSAASV
jgi:VIT1/CCC1 family predicted Fe2+/Mn2+ transporter